MQRMHVLTPQLTTPQTAEQMLSALKVGIVQGLGSLSEQLPLRQQVRRMQVLLGLLLYQVMQRLLRVLLVHGLAGK